MPVMKEIKEIRLKERIVFKIGQILFREMNVLQKIQ